MSSGARQRGLDGVYPAFSTRSAVSSAGVVNEANVNRPSSLVVVVSPTKGPSTIVTLASTIGRDTES